jgi:predicted nucleic acid binding AN1-type Zn finger protein
MPPITITKDNPSRPTNPATADPSQPHKTAQPMAEKDLESIGRHCQFEFCRQLDFLPFRCESCRGTFCLEHRTESAHKCAREGEWARRQQQKPGWAGAGQAAGQAEKPNIYNTNQCAHVACKTLINTLKDPGVTCPDCRGEFCLKHRLREEHDCRRPVGYGQGRGNNQTGGGESLRSMFSRVRSWGRDKSASASASASTATTNLPTRAKGKSDSTSPAAINALKKTAKGAASVPADRRVYLHVASGTGDNTAKADAPAGQFFYDARWKVGRVLDDAARRLGVENVNNRGGGEETRLRIFHVESGEFLEFSEGIGERVRSGQTIVLLRGAGVVLGKS